MRLVALRIGVVWVLVPCSWPNIVVATAGCPGSARVVAKSGRARTVGLAVPLLLVATLLDLPAAKQSAYAVARLSERGWVPYWLAALLVVVAASQSELGAAGLVLVWIEPMAADPCLAERGAERYAATLEAER